MDRARLEKEFARKSQDSVLVREQQNEIRLLKINIDSCQRALIKRNQDAEMNTEKMASDSKSLKHAMQTITKLEKQNTGLKEKLKELKTLERIKKKHNNQTLEMKEKVKRLEQENMNNKRDWKLVEDSLIQKIKVLEKKIEEKNRIHSSKMNHKCNQYGLQLNEAREERYKCEQKLSQFSRTITNLNGRIIYLLEKNNAKDSKIQEFQSKIKDQKFEQQLLQNRNEDLSLSFERKYKAQQDQLAELGEENERYKKELSREKNALMSLQEELASERKLR